MRHRRGNLSGRSVSRVASAEQLRRELAGADRLGPAGQAHVEVLGDLDLELAAVELDRDRARRRRAGRR